MAEALHNALRRGGLSMALTRALGVSEGSSGIERFGETLTPTIDLWGLPEWAHLRREALLSWQGSPAAVVAEYSGAALVNPVGSKTIVVVERVSFQATAQTMFILGRATEATIRATYAGVGGRGNQRDTRDTATYGPGRAEVLYGSDAALSIGVTWEFRTNPGTSQYGDFQVALPLVLTPGWGMIVSEGTVNQVCNVNIGWRERTAFPGELE